MDLHRLGIAPEPFERFRLNDAWEIIQIDKAVFSRPGYLLQKFEAQDWAGQSSSAKSALWTTMAIYRTICLEQTVCDSELSRSFSVFFEHLPGQIQSACNCFFNCPELDSLKLINLVTFEKLSWRWTVNFALITLQNRPSFSSRTNSGFLFVPSKISHLTRRFGLVSSLLNFWTDRL